MSNETSPKLVRELSLLDATMIVVGSMIGSGIFIVSAESSRLVGSPGWLLMAWALAGVLTITGALCCAELAAMWPRAGGQYVFLREAYGPATGFLFGWGLFLIIQTGTIAAVAVAFANFSGVLVDWSLRTSIEDVLAAGDCAEIVANGSGRNLIQQVWYTGKMQGEVAADVLAGEERTYDPGIWYNSAKFLDLEYQTYGRVGFNVPGERSLYWEHRNHRHAIRIVYTAEGVIGFNLMGLRYRHEVCERWIADRRPLSWVLDHLSEANFDPEFFSRHELEIVSSLKRQMD